MKRSTQRSTQRYRSNLYDLLARCIKGWKYATEKKHNLLTSSAFLQRYGGDQGRPWPFEAPDRTKGKQHN